MRAETSALLYLLFPCAVFPLDYSWHDVEVRDTLAIYLSATIVGRLTHSIAFDTASATTLVRTEMSVDAGDAAAGRGNRIMVNEKRSYTADGAMTYAYQEMISQSGTNSWKAVKTEEAWDYTVKVAGVATTRKINAIGDNLSSTYRIFKGIRDKTLRKGDTWRDTAFELMSEQPVITSITCIGVDTLNHRWILENKDDISGRAERQVLDGNGRTLEQSIEGMYVARAKNASARSDTTRLSPAGGDSATNAGPPAAAPPLTEMFSVAADREALPGESIAVLITDSTVSLDESVKDLYVRKKTLWVLRPMPSQCVSAGAATDTSLKQWLLPSVAVQSNHPDIIELSSRLRGNRKDPCAIITAFNHYVYSFLQKRNTATFSNALETLHAGYGDCGEHSALLTALLRASGIPARVVLGLLYVQTKKAYFYHAQVMAYSGRWMFADPTWDQFPAYGSSIPLIIDDTGSRALLLSRLINRLKITNVKNAAK
jgi:hypothetical protein